MHCRRLQRLYGKTGECEYLGADDCELRLEIILRMFLQLAPPSFPPVLVYSKLRRWLLGLVWVEQNGGGPS